MINKLIKRAKDKLRRVDQWRCATDPANPEWLALAHKYASQAEALIEFLELELCGSACGFDKGQEAKDRQTLKMRLDWVERRFKEKGID